MSASSTDFNIAPGQTGTVASALGQTGGNASLVVTGGGTLAISGPSTYGGGTTVIGGVLQASSTASLPGYSTAGKLSIGASGTLALMGSGWTSANVGSIVTSNSGNFAAGSNLAIDTTGGDFATQQRLGRQHGADHPGAKRSRSGRRECQGHRQYDALAGTLQMGNSWHPKFGIVPAGGALSLNGYNATAAD